MVLLQVEVDAVASAWRSDPDNHDAHGRNCECSKGRGAHGWPLGESRVWPGERGLFCPVCGSERVVMRSLGEFISGRWVQTGSARGLSEISCGHCSHSQLN